MYMYFYFHESLSLGWKVDFQIPWASRSSYFWLFWFFFSQPDRPRSSCYILLFHIFGATGEEFGIKDRNGYYAIIRPAAMSQNATHLKFWILPWIQSPPDLGNWIRAKISDNSLTHNRVIYDRCSEVMQATRCSEKRKKKLQVAVKGQHVVLNVC